MERWRDGEMERWRNDRFDWLRGVVYPPFPLPPLSLSSLYVPPLVLFCLVGGGSSLYRGVVFEFQIGCPMCIGHKACLVPGIQLGMGVNLVLGICPCLGQGLGIGLGLCFGLGLNT